MGIGDFMKKKKAKELIERNLYIAKVNLDNNYKKDVISQCKETYRILLEQQNEGMINDEQYKQFLRQINAYTKQADEKYYPIEKHCDK